VDADVSERRRTAAAAAGFARAIAEPGVTPERVVTDTAACHPPARRARRPAAAPRTATSLTDGLERDPGHLEQRLRPMRGCTQLAAAASFIRGHALIRDPRTGCSSLADRVPPRCRPGCAW
jgi:transposase-like protein